MKCFLVFFFFFLASFSTALADDDLVIGALGNSATAGVGTIGPLANRETSWSTGWCPWVYSHHQRLEDKFPHTKIWPINMSVLGATSKVLPFEAKVLALFHPDYVTVMTGANDICHEKIDLISVQENFVETIEILIGSNQNVKILIVPIPYMRDVYHWASTLDRCKFVDTIRNIECARIFNSTDEEREEVFLEVEKLNLLFTHIAQQYPNNVKFPEEIINYRIQPELLSVYDCFHPSLEGQNILSRLTWQYGWFN